MTAQDAMIATEELFPLCNPDVMSGCASSMNGQDPFVVVVGHGSNTAICVYGGDLDKLLSVIQCAIHWRGKKKSEDAV